MLHIILLILKIIGIVLLCIIGVIILVLIGVLFVPVRYRIEVMRKEGEEEPPVDVRVKVTWLLHLLNVLIRYPCETLVRVRLMIFTIWKMPFQKGQEGQSDQEDDVAEEGDSQAGTDREPQEKNSEKQSASTAEKIMSVEKEKIPTVTVQATRTEDESDETKEAPTFMDKLRALPVILRKVIEKIKSLFENIQYTIRRFCDKMKSISDNIQYYKALVESEAFHNSFGLCKEELTAILKSLKPQKLEAKLIVGMDDPAATGEILAVCGMLYPILGGHVDVTGDFERKRIEGSVFIQGKIRAWTFLRAAVRIYFNKDIKRLLRLWKKEAA